MISLSAGTPSPSSVEPKRPLTLDELEELHGVDPRSDRIPGVRGGLPWGRLFMVAGFCGLAGFTLPLVAASLGLDVAAIWLAIESVL